MLNLRLLFVILCLFMGIFTPAYALNLDKAKVYFLNGDYKSAILEGEKILATSESQSAGLDELYYLLGLSYLKDGNFLRASDIFEIILREFRKSDFKEGAKIGLADTYFLREDFTKAKQHYEELLESHPDSKFKALIFYRLSQVMFKKGDIQAGKDYLTKLKQSFPLNPEARLDKGLGPLSDNLSSLYYTVQVGSFSSSTNAQNLMQKLIQNNYPAYIEEIDSQGKTMYRVKVGKFSLRQEAEALKNKLSQDGYPTKISP